MPKAYKGSHSKVLAAVKRGQENHPVLAMAAQLCRRTGMTLRLVSVIEDVETLKTRYSPYEAFDFSALDRSKTAERRSETLAMLDGLAKKLELPSPVETSVVVGNAAEGIASDALVSGASLIATGAAAGSHQFVPRGLSTALTLMSESPLPVLVINAACSANWGRPQLKLLVADDLSESCERAVLVAFDLAVALGHTDVHHVHAHPLTIETFSEAAREIRNVRGQDADDGMSPTELWDLAQRNLHERLKDRAPIRGLFLETAGGHYWPEVRNGGVETELDRSTSSTSPDLIVFGRHQAVHRRPFAIGKVPFHFMLSQNRPLLVVPPR